MTAGENISIDKKETKISRFLKLLIKLVITTLCFWYISSKIDFSGAWRSRLKADWWWLFAGLVLYLISKLVAAFRLNIYFRNISIQLEQLTNIKLYWLGLFYNMFLPGSISGDAYKVVMLAKYVNVSYKRIAAAVLLDRFSGLLGLGVILCLFGTFVLRDKLWDLILIAASLCSILGLYLIIKRFFADFRPGFAPTFVLGLAVQAIQAGTVYCILWALGIVVHQPEWIFIFLVASVISVLPISLGGGLGTREFVFVEGSRFFHLDPQLGLVISLLFYLTSLIGHAGGLYFIFHDPLKKKKDR